MRIIDGLVDAPPVKPVVARAYADQLLADGVSPGWIEENLVVLPQPEPCPRCATLLARGEYCGVVGLECSNCGLFVDDLDEVRP